MRNGQCAWAVWSLSVILAAGVGDPARGQDGKLPTGERPALPPGPDRPLAEKLATPRATLKTLYFAAVAYDFYPKVIGDAIASLEPDPRAAGSPAEAAQRAIELETVLRELNLPLTAVPEHPDEALVVLHDADGFRVALRRQADGLWRFDRDTVERVPGMWRAALARHRNLLAERSALREGYTDPAATMRRFLIDAVFRGDFYGAARCLDLSALTSDQRRDRGPILAQHLAYVIQRRGWIFYQEIPDQPAGPPYTWHADEAGRILLERVTQPDGKDAWLFSKRTVSNLPRMVEQAQKAEPDHRYARLGKVVQTPEPEGGQGAAAQRPEAVPPHLGSPRATLKGFFRAMDDAEQRASGLADALQYLDLRAVPEAERPATGGKLAGQLEAVLRKVPLDLSVVPDSWNAPAQVFGEVAGFRIEVVRQQDGCWRFSDRTMGEVPTCFEKLAARERADRERSSDMASARDTMVTFLAALNHRDDDRASHCLDLSAYHTNSQPEIGPVLARKLKYVIDRIGRVYPQEIPDEPDGPRYVFHHSDLGRIILARSTAPGAQQGVWLFTPETVAQVETMFRAMLHRPVHESLLADEGVIADPPFRENPGVWLRLRLPDWAQVRVAGLEIYQWIGLALAVFLCWAVSRLVLAPIHLVAGWLLHHGGSALTTAYVARHLRPLTWLSAAWLFFGLLEPLDLPAAALDEVMPLQKFLMAVLIGWLCVHLISLATAVYTNSELLRPHRNLSDMVVPVSMRALKSGVVLVVVTYFVYQIGQGESLTRFLTGLGVAGLAASLAAQDALKNFFGTLLLIGERAFKLGDRIVVNGQEGVVEQVGFRSTRLRTADGTLLTIPNATIAAAAIDNRGARSFARYRSAFVVGYDTPLDHVVAFRDRIREYLWEQPKVDRGKLDVYVSGLKDNGVELLVSAFLATRDSAEDKYLRDQINCEILRLADELGISVANFKRPAATNATRPFLRVA